MKNLSKHSTTNGIKKRVPMFFAIFAALAMLVLNLAVKEPEIQPDSVHPMANANVTWLQTYYSGTWGEAD